MAGCLYGVGVGPGDASLLTLKAVRCIQKSPIIAIPAKDKKQCTAYQIAVQEIEEMDEKRCIYVDMPMTKDKALLNQSHDAGAKQIMEYLDQNMDVAFVTLGDPTIYSTFMYIYQRIKMQGYPTEIISGIPSFCAAAARVGISLGETNEQIHIIPASYDIEEALQLPGTKVLMKAGRKMADVKKILLKQKNVQIVMVENCGMPDEKIWTDLGKMPDQPGYFTLIIIRGV